MIACVVQVCYRPRKSNFQVRLTRINRRDTLPDCVLPSDPHAGPLVVKLERTTVLLNKVNPLNRSRNLGEKPPLFRHRGFCPF